MLIATTPTFRKYCIAAFNARLHKNSICPANHDVSYGNGWYYLDGNPEQKPEISHRARELQEIDGVEIMFNDSWNTYVLDPVVDV